MNFAWAWLLGMYECLFFSWIGEDCASFSKDYDASGLATSKLLPSDDNAKLWVRLKLSGERREKSGPLVMVPLSAVLTFSFGLNWMT